MWEKLKQLARRYDEIGELLEVPEIYADPKKLRALTREQKELSAVVETYRAYQKCEDDIVQALACIRSRAQGHGAGGIEHCQGGKRAPF